MKKKRKPGLPVFKEYNQDQMWLLPPSLDELIPANHIVRTVNTAINGMDLRSILRSYKGGGTSSYHPQMLLKVLIYAYTQRIYSARMIAKALRENIHFMWLSGNNRPDFRTINRFRTTILRENIEGVFAAVIELLLEKGLVRFENYFLDGTKIEANANKYSFVWKKATATYKAKLRIKIREVLDRVEEINDRENAAYGDADLEETGEGIEVTAEELEETIRKINEGMKDLDDEESRETEQQLRVLEKDLLPRLKKYEGYERVLGSRNSFSKTDPDATFMRMKEDHMNNGQLKAGYNIQIGTENQFILGYSLHQKTNDQQTLVPHIRKLENITGMLPVNIVADAGYGSEENYAFIDLKGMGNFVKYQYFHRDQRRMFKKEIFRVENLPYDPVNDVYTCPSGKKLRYTEDGMRMTDNGYVQKTRIYTAEDCRWCRNRVLCHHSKNNRRISINPVLNAYKKRVIENLTSEQGCLLRAKRSVDVESVFGHIKQNRGFKRFLLRGLKNVSTEWGLISIAHNLFKMNRAMVR